MLRKHLTTILIFIITLAITVFILRYTSPILYPQAVEADREIVRLVDEVKSHVEDIRDLKFPEETNVVVITREWVLKHWGPPPTPSKEMLYKEIVYKLTFLVPPDFSIVEMEKQWTASFMAATSAYTLHIVKENFNVEDPTAKRALAHELTHILQYHYFKPEYPETLDSKLAVLALIEGDADLTADMYCNLTGIPPRPQPTIPLNSPYIALQSFPYIYGENFVKQLYVKGGWTLVNEAYQNPPQTTEQIMHPEKYLRKEEPVKVTLTVNVTGDQVYVDVMGEYYILLVLASKINLEEAMEAAEGWNGDKVILYRNNKAWTLYWNITWDTLNDAKGFYNTFIEALRNIEAKVAVENNQAEIRIWSYMVTVTLNGKNILIKTISTAE